jgi:hypothetical protein
MSANISCYSKKYDQPRIEKIQSIIDDVKASIGFQTTSLSGSSGLSELSELSELAEEQLAKPSNLALSPAASEAQAEANKTSIEASESVIATNSTSTSSTSSTIKREKSPYVLAIGEISYQLCYGENYIGRDESNQIVIDDYHISRLHALVVVHSNNKVAIFDLGSLNGTFVKGRLIKCAALEVGDKIKLGSSCQLTLSLSLAGFGTVIKIKLKGQQIADSSLEQLNQSADGVINNDDQDNSSLIN